MLSSPLTPSRLIHLICNTENSGTEQHAPHQNSGRRTNLFLKLGHVRGDVKLSPAPIVAPVKGTDSLGIGLEATATAGVRLEQVSLDPMIQEHTAHVRDQDFRGILVRRETLS